MPNVDAEKHFAIVPEWLIYHPTLSSNAVRVYAVLARYAGGKGTAWPSYKTIGEHCSFTSRTAKRAVQELLDVGAITKRNRRGEDGAPTSNLYVVMTTDPADRGPAPDARGGDTPDPTGDSTDTSGDTGDRRGGVTGVTGVGSQMSHEGEPLNESHREVAADAAPDTGVTPTHQDIVDRLVAVCGLDLPLTKAEGGKLGKAAKGIRPVVTQLDDIDAKAAGYRRKWPDIDLTPTGLEANWSQIDADRAAPPDRGAAAVALATAWAAQPWDDVESRLLADGHTPDEVDAAREAWDLAQQAGAA